MVSSIVASIVRVEEKCVRRESGGRQGRKEGRGVGGRRILCGEKEEERKGGVWEGRRSCRERRKKVREGCGREEILCGEKEERKGGVWQGRGSCIHATRVKASPCMGW